MFGRKFGSRGPFIMEKIPRAISNYILHIKCGFSYSIGRKYRPVWVSGSDPNQNSGFGRTLIYTFLISLLSTSSTTILEKAHLFLNQCLHNIHFKKTRYFSPNFSKLAPADISWDTLFSQSQKTLFKKWMDFKWVNVLKFCWIIRNNQRV